MGTLPDEDGLKPPAVCCVPCALCLPPVFLCLWPGAALRDEPCGKFTRDAVPDAARPALLRLGAKRGGAACHALSPGTLFAAICTKKRHPDSLVTGLVQRNMLHWRPAQARPPV